MTERRCRPRTGQDVLFCGCGSADVGRNGACGDCERRARLSREHFAGLREAALARDDHQCQCCGQRDRILVHHRRPGVNKLQFLVTLCRACHVRVHLTARPSYAFSRHPLLYTLWREVHRSSFKQRLLALFEDDPEMRSHLQAELFA